MEVSDAIVSFFLRNIVAPRIYDMHNPGFIVSRFSDKEHEAYKREILWPEGLLSEIEARFVKEYGDNGERALYRAGKNFGYVYAGNSHFPRLSESNHAEIKKFSHMLILLISALWANQSKELLIDTNARKLKLRFWNYVLCSKNGIGHLLGDGGIAGIWAYIMQDDEIEGVQAACQGRGGQFCEFYAAPKAQLRKEGFEFYESKIYARDPAAEKFQAEINKIRQMTYNKTICLAYPHRKQWGITARP